MTTEEEAQAPAAASTTEAPSSVEHSLTGGSYEIDDLKHHDKPGETTPKPDSPERPGVQKSLSWIQRLKRGVHKEPSEDPLDWGQPGELSDEEVEIFVEFRKEVEKRDQDFKNTIYSFGEIEGEPFALCRWLRARKFNLQQTITMVEEATEERKNPAADDFYPDPKIALGIEPQVYISQYPQLYFGNAKSGSPLFISKPGSLNVNAITCITSMDGILKYHWYAMMHDFGDRLRAQKETNPDGFTRFQCMVVMDLEHLGTSQVTQRALAITKEQSKIDSLCFPETLERMVIVNSPRFFSMTWKLIRGWLDPRTSAKVELISSRSAWEKRLKELIDEDQLPKDYGGKAEETKVTLMKEAPEGCKRQHTELLSIRSNGHTTIDVNDGEKMDVIIFTRCVAGGIFSIVDKDKKVVVPDTHVLHSGGDNLDTDKPTRKALATDLKGPGKFKIKAVSKSGRLSTDDYFIVCNIY